MNTRLPYLFLSLLVLTFSFTAYSQVHDHSTDHKVEAEQIWIKYLSKDQIKENIQRTQLFSRDELDKLVLLFDQKYVQDRFYYFNMMKGKDDAALEHYCDSLSRAYKELFSEYASNKQKYMAEAEKAYAIRSSLSNTPLTFNGPCSNVDFEDGTTNGWDGWTGDACTNPVPCNLIPGLDPQRHQIQTGGYDMIVGGTSLPVVAPGGMFSLRLEDQTSGANASRISQTFLVTAANSNFTIRYAVVLEDPVSGHLDTERPYFNVSMTDQNGQSISCADYHVIAKPPIVGFIKVPGPNSFYYRNWTTVSIPLTAYIGQNVTITFDVSDCSQGAHTGYAYIDGSCLPFKIQTQYAALCSNDPVTLYGPDGYGSYQWTGPGIVGPSNIQNITVNVAGTYNLTMGSITGTGCTSNLVVILTDEAHPFAGNDTTVCVGNPVHLHATGIGPDAVWSPAALLDDPSSPTPTAIVNATTTFTVTSCGASDQVTVYVNNTGFNIASIPDVTLCNTSSTVLTVTPDVPGTYTYSWSPAATLSTANSSTTVASPTNPTTYTVQVTNADGCIRSEDVTVTVNNPIASLHAFAWPSTVCSGDSPTLTAGEEVIQDNCDVVNTSTWTITGGGGGSPCGSVSGDSYFFNGSTPRTLTTNNWLNMSGGGTINFYLKVSTGTAPCDDADAGENIALEYTTNGAVWTTIAIYNEANYPFFMPVSATIPAGASIDGVKFRFRQLTFTAAGQDTWGLDEIQIVRTLVMPGSTTGITYSWTPAADIASPNSMTTTATPTATSTYTLQLNNATTGCSYSSSVTVNVAPAFTLSLPTPVSICGNASATMNPTITPAGTYDYFWQNTSYISNQYIDNPVVNPPITTTYTLQVHSPGGCIRTANSIVNVVNAPVIKATSSLNPVCGPQTAQLNANEILISDTIQNTLNTSNWSIMGGVVSSSCGSVSGNAITFNGSGTRSLTTYTGLNTSTGGVIEFYLKIANGTGGCDDAESGDDLVLEYYNGTWNIMATFNEAAYPNFTMVRVPMPAGAISTFTSFRWRQLNHSGANTDICIIDNIRILRNLPSTYTYTYAWTPAATLNNAAAAAPSATPTTDTWYVVEVLSDGICPQKDSVLVRVVPDFSLSVNNPTVNTCVNSTTTLIAQTDLAAGGYSTIWSPTTGLDNPNSLTPELTVQGNSTYTITLISTLGCQKTATINVTPAGIGPMVTLTASKLLACPGEQIQLDASVVNASCGTTGACNGTTTAQRDLGSMSSFTLNYPLTGYYHDGRTQILYTKAELLSFGFQPGEIIKTIALNVYSKGSSAAYNGFTIRMGCTGLSSFSFSYVAGNTVVFTPKSVTTNVGWNTFNLDSPYMWDGNSNLIVEICFDNTFYTYNDLVYSIPSSAAYSALYSYSDNSTGCIMSSPNVSYNRPFLRMTTCSGVTNTAFTWTPTTGLSDPGSLHPVFTALQTTTYSIQVSSPNGCVSTRSKTIAVDNSNIADVWADTTCLNGAPVPIHANYSGTAVNTAYNCNTLTALPTSTTPYVANLGTSPGTNTPYPFYGYYTGARSQYLITAAELNAAGVSKGAISKMSLMLVSKGSSVPFNGLTIKLGCTSATTLASGTFITGTSVVYNPKSYTTTVGVNSFVFDQAYAWDGSSNLIVEICWSNVYTVSPDYLATAPTSYISSINAFGNSTAGCDIAFANNTASYRPTMTFTVYPPDPVGLTYSWSTHSGSVASPNSANTSVTTTTNTWAVFTLSGGVCTVKDSVYIRPNQLPIVLIDSTLDCPTGIFTFNSNAASFTSYQWTPAVTGNPTGFTVNPVSDLYYVLSVTNDLLCVNKDSVQVRTDGGPFVLPEDTLLCEGLDISFSASGGDGYSWQYPGHVITGVDHIDFQDVTDPVPLTLVMTRHNGCQITDTWTLDIMDSLNVELDADLPYACMGLPNHLTASGSDVYTWTPSALFSNNDADQHFILTTDTEIKVESSNRCFTDSAKIMLIVKEVPIITKAADTTICYASAAYLHATYDPLLTYTWTPAATLDNPSIYNPVAHPTGTTTYYADINNGWCSAHDTVVVTVLGELVAQIDASATEGDIPFNPTLASHSTADAYSWYTYTNSTPFSTAQQTNFEMSAMGEDTVYLQITNSAGCTAIAKVHLLASYIFIPNLVTPNGDGDNDTYKLVEFGHQWSITVFNRWGEQVYKNDNYHNEWGADNVTDGMYYYEVVEKKSSRTWKGWVHVMSRKE